MIDFNNINENITDEMLAAYIDGNANENEKSLIESSLSEDPMLSEIVDIANDSKYLSSDFDWELHKGDYGFWELGLPPILSEDDLSIAADNNDLNIGVEHADIIGISNIVTGDCDLFNIESPSLEDFENPDEFGGLSDIDDITDSL